MLLGKLKFSLDVKISHNIFTIYFTDFLPSLYYDLDIPICLLDIKLGSPCNSFSILRKIMQFSSFLLSTADFFLAGLIIIIQIGLYVYPGTFVPIVLCK